MPVVPDGATGRINFVRIGKMTRTTNSLPTLTLASGSSCKSVSLMKNGLSVALLLFFLLLELTSFAQSKTDVDSVIANTQYIQKGEAIIDVGGKNEHTFMYSRVTNNNKLYTDSTATIDIQSLYKILQNGYKFHDLAINYSQDPGSYLKGGELKPTTMDEYVSEFRNIILSLQIGEISMPFKTDFGYHIAQLIAMKDGIYTTRHILLRVD